MEVWYWECRLTAFLPEFTLFKPFLLFVIFQNVLANTAFNNQGIIFILQIYADQKIFNCETFIEMSVWERGKRSRRPWFWTCRLGEGSGKARLWEQHSHRDYLPAYFSVCTTSPFWENLNMCPYRQKGTGKLKAVWSWIEVSSELSSAGNGRLTLMFFRTTSVDTSSLLWKSFLSLWIEG